MTQHKPHVDMDLNCSWWGWGRIKNRGVLARCDTSARFHKVPMMFWWSLLQGKKTFFTGIKLSPCMPPWTPRQVRRHRTCNWGPFTSSHINSTAYVLLHSLPIKVTSTATRHKQPYTNNHSQSYSIIHSSHSTWSRFCMVLALCTLTHGRKK